MVNLVSMAVTFIAWGRFIDKHGNKNHGSRAQQYAWTTLALEFPGQGSVSLPPSRIFALQLPPRQQG